MRQVRHCMVRAWPSPYASLGSSTTLDLASDPVSHADPLEQIFSKLITSENQVHELQAASSLPMGLPSKVNGSS